MVDYVFERHLSGGILLPANKTASTSRPIHRGFIPSRLVLAVRQHRGPGAVPCVQIGDRVLKGQTIATAATVGPSAAVHASSSGWVRGIEEHPVLTSDGVAPSLCIMIETDGRDERVPETARPAWPTRRAKPARFRYPSRASETATGRLCLGRSERSVTASKIAGSYCPVNS